MRLTDLIEGYRGLRIEQGDGTICLTDLTDDSRQVQPGTLFIARGGEPRYLADAIQRGAVAVISSDPPAGEPGSPIAWVRADQPVDQAMAGHLAERFFGHPSRELALIGVTGTNGKTTTAFLIQHLLRQAGVHCGLIGTVFIDDGSSRRIAELTTPGAIDLSRLLADMVRHGCRAAVAEVSSHALHQGRTAALDFHAGIFTNLTGDHLDYHGSMDAYADAKALLFEQLGQRSWAIINADDDYSSRMIERCQARILACTMQEGLIEGDRDGSTRATVLDLAADHCRARFDGPWGSVEVRLPLVGRHNIYNTLEAIAAANTVTAMARTLREALTSSPPVPGRLEPVQLTDTEPAGDSDTPGARPFDGPQTVPTVLVDYAHTHDALENVLLALKPVVSGRLIVVFGCGGDRDRSKRPKMAAVACKLADRVVITSDNPRTEDPQAIIRDIQQGVPAEAACRVTVVTDRAEAIARTIVEAQPNDTVLLAGKGHEDYQIVPAEDGNGTVKRHFDDREHAAAALRRRAQMTTRGTV